VIVVGNPANRRVAMFQAALAAEGQAPAHVIAWRDLIVPGAPAHLLGDARGLVRIDSSGEDDEVERGLLARGGAPPVPPYQLGRIDHPRLLHAGLVAVLGEIEAATLHVRHVQPPPAIRLLFDKAECSRRWRALGIPMPEVIDDVRSPDELRERMRELGWPTVFVKLTSGSSASCVAMFTHTATGEHAITTIEDTGRARFNTRNLQRLTTARAIDRTLGFIIDEGAHVERAIDKAQLDGRFFDLRVLAVDGVAAFVVMRTSPHEITNLHLGGLRGDVDALRAKIAPSAWDAALASAVRVQQASGAFHVGVDLMFEPNLRDHRVIEGNAFGDLLPNLTRDGTDVYGWQIRRLVGTVRA
jgi:glutathione synthase/RimK-type ligase-like ATP-grasp enzyme